MNVVMEEEQEMDATERSRTECNRHDGPMVAAFCSFRRGFPLLYYCILVLKVPGSCLWPPN
jgi:hypothetical protein